MRPFISCLTAAKNRKESEEDMLHSDEHELSNEPR